MKKRAAQLMAGFTLIELLVSVGIFILMTTLLMVKYGNFNQSVLLTNLAYDVAVTIRTAQTYGLSVKNVDKDSTDFTYAYGVYLSVAAAESKQLIFFRDDAVVYDLYEAGSGDFEIDTYAIKRGAYISELCLNNVCNIPSLSISFMRPDPNARLCYDDGTGNAACGSYAEITIMGGDGTSIRKVTVRENGQISVKE